MACGARLIWQEHHVYDSKRKLKAVNLDVLANKVHSRTTLLSVILPQLTSAQKQVIDLNQCLLELHMNQFDSCRRLAQKHAKLHPKAFVRRGSEWASHFK
jgi:hypothetical protein